MTIAAGADVEIAPGATITCAAGETLFVAGTLHARAASTHARITCERWAGLVVSAGGRVDLEGVELELENGTLGLGMAAGASASTFTDAPSTKLGIAKAKLSTPVKVAAEDISVSAIEGALVASHIDYDANGNEGISVKKGGELDLRDYVPREERPGPRLGLRRQAPQDAFSTFLGAHCGLHVQPSESFEIEHVTSDSNVYGVTIYGSGNGPNTVTASNFTGSAAWVDFQGDNGAITPGPRREAALIDAYLGRSTGSR